MTIDHTKKLASCLTGKGPAIVLLHGMAASHKYWQPLQERLSRDHTVLSMDLLGFGDSPMPPFPYTYDAHTAAVAQTINDSLLHNVPFILVGDSMGALIALNYAHNHGARVKALLLTSMPIFATAKDAKKGIINGSIVNRLLYFGVSAELICRLFCGKKTLSQHLIKRLYHDTPPDVAKDLLKHTWHSYSLSRINIIENQRAIEQLKSITLPTALLYGADDPFKNHTRIDNALITEKIVEGANHFLGRTHLEEVAGCLDGLEKIQLSRR